MLFPKGNNKKNVAKIFPDNDNKKELKKFYFVCQLYTLILIPMIVYCLFIFFGFIVFDSSGNMRINFMHLFLYIISGLIELLGEPIILFMNIHMENILIGATIGDFIRIFSSVFFAIFFKMDLWFFTFSRLLGSICYLIYILYLGEFKYNIDFMKFIPNNIKIFFKKENNIDGIDISPLKDIFFQFVKLTLLNMILSNCENLILSFVVKQSNEEKGEYSFIIENFSIITRLILKPTEDTFFNLINKLKNYENKKEKENNNNEIIFDSNPQSLFVFKFI